MFGTTAAEQLLVLDGSWLARLSGRPELSEWHSRWLDYLAEWASAAPGTADPAAEPEEVAAEAIALNPPPTLLEAIKVRQELYRRRQPYISALPK